MDPNDLLTLPEPTTRREAVEQHTQIERAMKGLFDKGDAMTHAEGVLFDKLAVSADKRKEIIARAPDPAAMKAKLDAHSAFAKTAVRPVPPQTGPPAGGGERFQLTGLTPDGHTVVNRERNVVEEVGRSILGDEAWDGMQDPTYAKAFFGEYLRKGERMSAAAYKALEVGADTQGGYFAPPVTLSRVIGRQPTPTRVAGMCDVVTSASGDAVQAVKVNYASNSSDDPNGYIFPTGFRVSWGNEETDQTTNGAVNDANLFGMARIPVYEAVMTGRITFQQAEDAGFDTQGWMEARFNETSDLLNDQMVLLGTGINMPDGIVPLALSSLPAGDPIKVITTANVNSIVADDILDISEDLPEQYDDNARFVFSKTVTNKAIRKLKDNQNLPIFRRGAEDNGLSGNAASRKMLNGYETVWSQFMQSIATGNIPIIFGDLKGYTRVVRVGFSIQVLREIEALKKRIVLMGRLRIGGSVLEPWRLRALKVQ